MRRLAPIAILLALLAMPSHAQYLVGGGGRPHVAGGGGGCPSTTGNLLVETFDGGTEDNTWTETTGSGNSQDDDDTTNPPLTSETCFETQQLKMTDTNDNDRVVRYAAFTAQVDADAYGRAWIYISAEGMEDGQTQPIMSITDSTCTTGDCSLACGIAITQSAGIFGLCFHEASSCTSTAAAVNTGEAYRLEWWVDDATNAGAWWIDGVPQAAPSSGCSFDPARINLGPAGGGTDGDATVYYDNVSVWDSSQNGGAN